MGTQRNAVEWEFLLDQRQLERGLKKSRDSFSKTNKSSNTLKDSMGKLKKAAGALGLVMSAKAILKFGKDSIDAATDYEESVNAVKVLSGEAATEILKIGESAAESFGLSRTEFNDTAIAFAGFNDQLDSIEPAQTFEDFIGRASDFASVVNIDVKDAVKLFSSTLAGESEPIRRYGKNLSAAAVQAYAVESGISAIGATMTESEKVRARYGLLMEETAEFAGDFANTPDEAAGKTKILTAKLKDQQVLLGKELLPVYNDLLTIALDLAPAMSGVSKSIASTIQPIADLTGVVSNLMGASDNAFWSMDTLEGGLNAAMGVAEKINPIIGLTSWAMDKVGIETRIAAGATDELAESVTASDDALTRGGSAAGDFAGAVGDAADAADDAAESTQELNDALFAGLDPVGQALDKYSKLQDLLVDIDEDGERSADELLDLAEATLDVAGAFDELSADDINQAVGSLSKALGISETAARDLLEELGLLDGKTISTKVLLDFVGSIGGRKVTTTVGMKADGGPVSAGKPYIVGEEGPELIVPNTSGTVIPNGGSGGGRGVAGGGSTINITVNALDPDAAAVAVVDAIRSYRDRYGEI